MNNIYLFTLIKDEQRYIDEWLQYNIKIGFDKIILFEDINSSPHDISKYSDKVILHKILDCFNDMDKQSYNQFKQKGIFTCFKRLYFNECDWCICIDVDEYIDCPNIHDSIIGLTEYAQIMFFQNIYTYSGHINDPYPNKKYSIQETYTTKAKNGWELKSLINTHHNISKNNFDKPFHCPHRIVEHTHPDAIFSKFCYKHYATKSFEEFMDDLYNKGRMDSWTANIDRFFETNDLDKTKELQKNEYKTIINKYKNKKIKINNDIL